MTTTDYAAYTDKVPNDLHKHLAAWITEKTGAKVDVKSVGLAIALHGAWQASPENKARNAARRAEKAAALKERATRATTSGKAAKTTKKVAAKAPAKKAAAAKKTTAPAKKVAAAKKTTAKKSATRPTETPF